jgi:hydrogenase nickel incorporation protein HypA/HybF
MHELSLCRSIAATARSHAAGRPVSVVRVQIGALRQVVPDSLLFCWKVIREFEGMPDAELKYESVPAALNCTVCGNTSEVSVWSMKCPACGSTAVNVANGNEFIITSIDVTSIEVSQSM